MLRVLRNFLAFCAAPLIVNFCYTTGAAYGDEAQTVTSPKPSGNASKSTVLKSKKKSIGPLPKVNQVKNCRASMSFGQSIDETNPPEDFKVLRVYIKKDGKAQLEPFAELKFDLPQDEVRSSDVNGVNDASAQESAEIFPYKVSGGTVLNSTPPNCDSLVGKIAVDKGRDPILTAQLARDKINAEESSPIEEKQETSANPQVPQQQIPEQSEAEKMPPQPTDYRAQVYPPLVELSLGFDTAQIALSGLYIDANTDTSLLMIGKTASAKFYPALLFSKKLSPSAYSAIRLLALHYSFSSLDSAKRIKVKREGNNVGIQETRYNTQKIAIDYAYSYLKDRLQTGISAIVYAKADLLHSVQFDPGIEGGGASIRDIHFTCQGIELFQGYRATDSLTFPFTIFGGARFCLKSTSTTPAITLADFPNSNTKFSGSSEIGAFLRGYFPIDSKRALAVFTNIEIQRWVGSLELSDNQTIDSAVTVIGGVFGLNVGI